MAARYIQPPSVEDVDNVGKSNKKPTKKTGFRSVRLGLLRAGLAFVALMIMGPALVFPLFDRSSSISDLRDAGVDINDPVAVNEYFSEIGAPHSAEAFACSDILRVAGTGGGISSGGGFTDPPAPDASPRKFTMNEAYTTGTALTTYYGQTEESPWLLSSDQPSGITHPSDLSDLGDIVELLDTEEVERLEAAHGWGTCIFSGNAAVFTSLTFWIAQLPVNIAMGLTSFAFDSNFICSDPENPQGNCVNLVGVIGGGGDADGGIIGALTDSIYIPLAIIAVVLGAFSILWIGIVKRQYRQALYMSLWVVASFVIGLALLWNPNLLAKAPQNAMNFSVACIMGAFSGDNCMTGSSSGSPIDIDEDGSSTADLPYGNNCISRGSVDGNQMEQANATIAFAVNGMTCRIHEAFIVNGWTQAQFGRGYNQMRVNSDNEYISNLIEETQESIGSDFTAEGFCVNLVSTNSWYDMAEGNAEAVMNRSEYLGNSRESQECNVAALHLALSSSTEHRDYGTSDPPTERNNDERWNYIAALVVHDEEMWEQWSAGSSFGTAILTLVTAGLGAFIVFFVALYALVYYVSAIILIVFAPLFFLIAIHPGRGKKIFLGWLEQLVSNVLKYIASALFLLITIALYAAVLGNAEGVGTAFIFVLIMTMALYMYRKEIVELIGKVNYGGEQLNSAAMDRFKKKFDIEDPNSGIRKAGKSAAGYAGAGSAALAAKHLTKTGRQRRAEEKNATKHKLEKAESEGAGFLKKSAIRAGDSFRNSGLRQGVGGKLDRDLQRGNGVLSNAWREGKRTHQNMKQENKQQAAAEDEIRNMKADEKREEAQRSQSVANESQEEVKSLLDQPAADKNNEPIEKPQYTTATGEDGRDKRYTETADELGEQDAAHQDISQQALALTTDGMDADEAEALKLSVEFEDLKAQELSLNAQKTEAEQAGDIEKVAQIEHQINLNANAQDDVKNAISATGVDDITQTGNLRAYNDNYASAAKDRGMGEHLMHNTSEDVRGNSVRRVIGDEQRNALADANAHLARNAESSKGKLAEERGRIEDYISKEGSSAKVEGARKHLQEARAEWRELNPGQGEPPRHVQEKMKQEARAAGEAAEEAKIGELEEAYKDVLNPEFRAASDVSRNLEVGETSAKVDLNQVVSEVSPSLDLKTDVGGSQVSTYDVYNDLNGLAEDDSYIRKNAASSVMQNGAGGEKLGSAEQTYFRETLKAQDAQRKQQDLMTAASEATDEKLKAELESEAQKAKKVADTRTRQAKASGVSEEKGEAILKAYEDAYKESAKTEGASIEQLTGSGVGVSVMSNTDRATLAKASGQIADASRQVKNSGEAEKLLETTAKDAARKAAEEAKQSMVQEKALADSNYNPEEGLDTYMKNMSAEVLEEIHKEAKAIEYAVEERVKKEGSIEGHVAFSDKEVSNAVRDTENVTYRAKPSTSRPLGERYDSTAQTAAPKVKEATTSAPLSSKDLKAYEDQISQVKSEIASLEQDIAQMPEEIDEKKIESARKQHGEVGATQAARQQKQMIAERQKKQQELKAVEKRRERVEKKRDTIKSSSRLGKQPE